MLKNIFLKKNILASSNKYNLKFTFYQKSNKFAKYPKKYFCELNKNNTDSQNSNSTTLSLKSGFQ